jgi:hypothetical protein
MHATTAQTATAALTVSHAGFWALAGVLAAALGIGIAGGTLQLYKSDDCAATRAVLLLPTRRDLNQCSDAQIPVLSIASEAYVGTFC